MSPKLTDEETVNADALRKAARVRYYGGMKILVASDLHFRIAEAREGVDLFADINADAAVLAGDMTDGLDGVHWLGRTLAQRMDVVFVLGNHCLYGEDMVSGYRRAADIARNYDRLHLVQDSDVIIDGVRFIGSTLWTDYRLFEDVGGASAAECMRAAKGVLGDFEEIDATAASAGRMGRRLTARDTVGFHESSRRYLEGAFSEGYDGKTVVVTHHAVSHQCISQQFAEEASSAAFASNLDDFVADSGADLWVHGHVHNSVDIRIGGTRVLCNARGYNTNASFLNNMVVEV